MFVARQFIVILIWGWQTGNDNGVPITYPHIHFTAVFDAVSMGKIRDYGWLWNQRGRIKGIDLCTPIINGQEGKYKAEERNLGKLMRIQLPNDLPKSVPDYDA